MDFDRYFTRVQICLRSLEKNCGVKFLDITSENDEAIGTVVESFSSFLKELDAGPENLRKINLFLLINSDFESINLLHNDINFCHLFNTIPKMSSTLYFQLTNHTDLYKYIGELIVNCPEIVVVDLLKCVSACMKSIRVEIANQFLYLIYEGLYKKILNLQNQNSEENIKQKFVKIFQTLFEFSIHDILNSDWQVEKNLVKKQCYFGYYIKAILNLIENCISMFNSDDCTEKIDLYKMKIDYDYKSWTLQTKEDNWSVYCIQVMVCKCKKIMKEVNVDIYMAWCEEDYIDNTGVTLQTAVREAAYNCIESLNTILKYEEKIVDLSFLITGLNKIAIKPRSEDDEIKNADKDTIAKNMNDPNKTQLKWLKTYLDMDNVLLDNRCIDDLKNLTNLFTKTYTLQLIGMFTKHLASNELSEQSVELCKQLILDCVRQLKVEEQLDILNIVAANGTDTLKTSNFNQNLTETFNKLVNKNEKMEKVVQDIIVLALESGQELVTFLLADCLKAANLCDLLVQILVEVPFLTKYKVSSTDSTPLTLHCTLQHFNQALESGLEDRTTLVHMIKKLSWFSIINGKDFIISHLIPVIQKSVPAKKWKDIDLCLDIFEVFVNGSGGEHVQINEAEIIAFLTQVLNQARLQPHQFTVHSGQVIQKISNSLYPMVNSFLMKKSSNAEKEKAWLRDYTKSLSPMAWFPLRKLWTSSGLNLPPDPNNMLAWSKQYLGRKDLLNMNEDDRSAFVIQLCKVLPLLSLSEWRMIGFELGGVDRSEHCVAVFHILADCLLVLYQLPVVYGNPSCMAHLISGYTSFFKMKAVHALKHCDRNACLMAFNKQVVLANELGPDVMKIRLAALATVLQDIAMITLEKASKNHDNSDLLATIASLKEPQIQSMLSNKISV